MSPREQPAPDRPLCETGQNFQLNSCGQLLEW
jgi:hypothetical protein